jgi:tetrahydromethanopterin S-methyltransferase subunit A
MTPEESLQTIQTKLAAGIVLSKCQKCGCMDSTLKHLAATLPRVGTEEAFGLTVSVAALLKHMRPVQHACLGCEYCYPAVAQNAFAQAFPALGGAADVHCEFRVRDAGWPPVVGEYFVLDRDGTVAVSTLASLSLSKKLAQRKPHGLAIVGKTETENIGVDKVIKNIVTSPTLRYLLVAGLDPKGHLPGRTLLALAHHGVDDRGRVIDSPGKRPMLRNVSVAEIQAFRRQVHVIDMVGCDSADEISARVEELAQPVSALCGCNAGGGPSPVSITTIPKTVVTEPSEVVKLDKTGYFVIVLLPDKGVIDVEHYAYDNTLLHVIEGTSARAIYTAIINGGWVTELSHAAYLGKELAKAEYALQHGGTYVQDGA